MQVTMDVLERAVILSVRGGNYGGVQYTITASGIEAAWSWQYSYGPPPDVDGLSAFAAELAIAIQQEQVAAALRQLAFVESDQYETNQAGVTQRVLTLLA
jgi:hypothetical protein